MGNPFYFADSRYSNAAQIGNGSYNTPFMMASDHHLLTAIKQVAEFTILFWPFGLVALVIIIFQLRKKVDFIGLPILLGSFGTPILQIMLLYKHASAEWARFFIYYIPFGFMLSGYIVYLLEKKRKIIKHFLLVLSIPIFISADILTLHALQNPIWGNGESGFVNEILKGTGATGQESSSGYFSSGKEIATYINAHPNLKVIMSSFTSFYAIPYINNPNNLVISNDSNYNAVLANPRGIVNAILVTNYTLSNSTRMSSLYPGLWAGQVTWTKLIKQFSDGTRLYAILPDAP